MNTGANTSRPISTPLLPYAFIGALALVAVLMPIDRRLAMEILIVLAMAQGWNLLCGYTGLLSFGHHAFIGLGAYVLYMAVNTTGVSPFPVIALSATVATLVALAMWLLLRHLRGPYFSIAIWVLADSLRLLFAQWDWVGSSRGIVLNVMTLDPSTFSDTLFYTALGLACATFAGTFALLRSRMGLALMAIRDNESGAASVGIAVSRNQLAAFLISAAICGAGGGLYYLSVLYVDPSGAFDINWQLRLVFIVIVGGVGTLEGPLVGTLLYFGLRELFRDAGDVFLIVQGATAMAVMLFLPSGIWGFVQSKLGWSVFPIRRLA
jgi:branched-chain amino acid transport system permease protein